MMAVSNDGDHNNEDTPGDWGGDERPTADGWITTWAGDSAREVSGPAEAYTEEIMSAKDKKARRCKLHTT